MGMKVQKNQGTSGAGGYKEGEGSLLGENEGAGPV